MLQQTFEITNQKALTVLAYRNRKVIEVFRRDHPELAEKADNIFTEMLKFLFTCMNSTIPLKIPSPIVDKMWHTFIICTKEYHEFCQQFFGTFINHMPFDESLLDQHGAYAATRESVHKIFGALDLEIWPKEKGAECCGLGDGSM